MKPFFRKKQMMSGVYSIAGEAVIRYLIIGEHHALLFDTGYGFGDLASFVKSLTDLPLYVGQFTRSHRPCRRKFSIQAALLYALGRYGGVSASSDPKLPKSRVAGP